MTRRVLISLCPAAFLSFRVSALAADPWTAKKPADWTEKDRSAILTKSPWAKQASIEFGDPGDGGFGGRGGPGFGGPGGGPPPGGGFPGGGGFPDFNVLVRWDSALPVRLAAKSSPEGTDDDYLIFVSGPPMPGNPDNEDQDSPGLAARMNASTTSLQRKDKEPIYPEHIETVSDSDQAGILCSFRRTPGTIAATDKEVTFVTAMGPLHIKAKFTLKDMLYQGRLEL